MSLMVEQSLTLPPKPEEPLPSDCCGNGCSPCILDIYQEELAVWEAECLRTKEEQDKSQVEIHKLEKDRYHGFVIVSITPETKDTIRVRFDLPKSQSLGLSVGEHIVIRAKKSNGLPLTRQYTPISPIQSKGYFEFLLKIYPYGQMSNIMKSWLVGDMIDMRGPLGNFNYAPNKHRKVLMLCAGTGIAPMCQVIHAILDNENDETLVRLVYACKTYPQILAKSELSEWKRYWNFSAVFMLSQEPESAGYAYSYGEEIIKGRIDETFIQNELHHHLEQTLVLICGTTSFESDMLAFSRKIGVFEHSIHKF